MLEKTLAMLKDIKPGTYVPDDVECFDPAELNPFGWLLHRLMYGPSSIRRFLQQHWGTTITRSDFYSEIPTISELERSFAAPSLLKLDGVFPDGAALVAELERLLPFSQEFDPPQTGDQLGEYVWKNGQFSHSDAMSYYTMIRARKPRTIVEIGSGWSTSIARMACAKNGFGRIVCIEPFPSDHLKAVPGIELINSRAQDVETSVVNDLLSDGDMFFIDSTHTVKHDGDCLHIYLRILPALTSDVTVHVHDIPLPDTLSLSQMRDGQIFWNEQYLLYAYMCCNPRTRTLFGSRYHSKNNLELLTRFMHGRAAAGGGSFWFQQSKA